MAKPVGIKEQKVNHTKKKNPRAHDGWMKTKKANRPKQVFVDTTRFNSSEEIDALTDAQILALPKAHWQKVSA